MRNNKGVTLINMIIIIIVLVIIASVSIIGGTDILNSSKESKKEENLAAVKTIVNQINIKYGTEGIFTPGGEKLYGKPAMEILSGDETNLEEWYILDENTLKEIGIDYFDVEYIVNYKDNKVYTIHQYEKDNSIILGDKKDNDTKKLTITGADGKVLTILKTSEILNENMKNNSNISMVLQDEKEEGQVPIPKGFEYVLGSEESGLVIKDKYDNEFVWIPVPNPKNLYEEADSEIYLEEGVVSTTTKRFGKSEYMDSLVMDSPATAGTYREPDILNGSSYDTNSTNLSLAGFSNIQELADDLTSEFNNMIDSVIKYKGFYIGRYELGYQDGVVCKPSVPVVTAATAPGDKFYGSTATSRWYGLYKASKKFSTDSVQSAMIWSCQWDAMLSFAGSKVCSSSERKLTGEYGDVRKNIHDVGTSVCEWTSTAWNNGTKLYRSNRSAVYNENPMSLPTDRFGGMPYKTPNIVGTRPQLYIK